MAVMEIGKLIELLSAQNKHMSDAQHEIIKTLRDISDSNIEHDQR